MADKPLLVCSHRNREAAKIIRNPDNQCPCCKPAQSVIRKPARVENPFEKTKLIVWEKQQATTTDAPAELIFETLSTPTLHRGAPNTGLRGARKGTGDTKTECYYLFSTHFGTTSEHTKPHSHSPHQQYPLIPFIEAHIYVTPR